MPLSLAPGITFVEQDGMRVFLDLNRDRYFALGELNDHAFAALVRGKPVADQKTRLLTLVEQGILVDTPFGDNPRPCRHRTATASALDEPGEVVPSSSSVLAAAWSIVRAKSGLRARSLATNVERLRELKGSAAADIRPARHGECEKVAAAFAIAGQLVPTLDQCLALSFAMARRCLRSGLDTQLSIGVKMRPFEAHAWVSVQGVVVSDRLENVRPFAPILLV